MSTKIVLAVALLAVTGFAGGAYTRADFAQDRSKNSFVIAADDSGSKMQPDKMQTDEMKPDDTKPDDQAPADDKGAATGSAKMGTDEGTHTGDGQGAAPESDTSKVDQPVRRNVPTNDDAVTK
jgi:hypothetical protein